MSYFVPPISKNTIYEEVSRGVSAASSGYYSGVNSNNLISLSNNLDFLGAYGFTLAAEVTTDSNGAFRVTEAGAETAPYLTHSGSVTQVGTFTAGLQNVTTRTLPSNSKLFVVAVYNKTTGISIFFNGQKVGSTAHTAWGTISGSTNIFRGNATITTIGHSFFVYNKELTDAEVAIISNGKRLTYREHGASGAAQTSGNLIVGKQYRIATFQAGDDFTNVGAASNASGVVFTATGTTPTTWSNSSSLVQLGLVLDFTSAGAGPNTWMNNNVAGPNASVTGMVLINRNALSADKHVMLSNLPTSASGLAPGRVWNDAGTLKIVT